MRQLVDSASEGEGFVLFDTPGNVSQDGLLPLFAGADFIVCPFDYEDKTLDSTGTFVSVLAAIRQHVGDMQARVLFVPNRIDPRVGTKEEQRMWNEAAPSAARLRARLLRDHALGDDKIVPKANHQPITNKKTTDYGKEKYERCTPRRSCRACPCGATAATGCPHDI